jgi:hypothetical protein
MSQLHEEHPGHHEESDVSIKGITRFLVIMTVGVGVICVFLVWMFNFLAAKQGTFAREVVMQKRELPPLPRLQVTPVHDLESQRAREQDLLGKYVWLDKSSGSVRIPIERAMDLVVERGLPSRKTGGAK